MYSLCFFHIKSSPLGEDALALHSALILPKDVIGPSVCAYGRCTFPGLLLPYFQSGLGELAEDAASLKSRVGALILVLALTSRYLERVRPHCMYFVSY